MNTASNGRRRGCIAITGVWLAGILFVLAFNTAPAQWTQTSFPQNQIVLSLTVHGGIIFAGTSGWGMYASTDSGNTWTARNNGLASGAEYAMIVHRNAIFAGGTAGVHRSTDYGASWTPRNNGLPITAALFHVMAFAADSADIFAGTTEGIFRSSDNGGTWINFNNSWGSRPVSALALKDSILLAGANHIWQCGLARSTDRGMTWLGPDTLPPPNFCVNALMFVDTIAFAGIAHGVPAGSIYRSSNFGIAWIAPDTGSLQTSDIRCFAYAGNTLFAGSADYNLNSSALASNDFGRTFRSIASGLPSAGSHPVLSMAVLDTILFVAPGGSGIWKRPLSQIVPVTLSFLSARLENGIEKLEWKTESEKNTQGFEIQRREEARTGWINIGFVAAKGSGAGSASYEYAFRPESSPVSGGRVQFRLKIVDYDGTYECSAPVDLAMEAGANEFQLNASYPNPADRRAVLEFALSSGARVRLSIMNMLGMVARKVVDDELGPGLHSYPVDTSGLPRGMYLCVLQAGSNESVRTMIVK